ncbi:ABC-F family ATP-binding cassette domain-containing protein [Terriglobus albidus]|uniref:ABC-F family ATP-binding cassette domain-containing protein n=1 Tax=Terriglobus albidus TaxID=1592106 RepID=A0A5B9EE31_9BACT|nr:ABC-F family ATP-binding cassette domain-containing protein [Terriglobus albidus]QEE29934.1 ABC-F family ATP-binding cassette domain-containing protein [Terriglobus albidus]
MPPILNARTISKAFGALPLFRDISLTISDGDRIGLIGPNGAGKSTLLSILGGQQEPDSGEVASRKRARVAYVAQDSEFAPGRTVRRVLEDALANARVSEDEHDGRLHETVGRAGFPSFDSEAASLSGGWRKRLAIAEATITHPDVLMLDEPTNHLDLEGIEWLEDLVQQAPYAVVTISHDRYFLENVVTDIIELNRVYAEGLLRVRGSYSRFLEEKQSYLASQSREQEALRNRVRTEIDWLRRGPKARTTKSKARIDKANELIGQLADVNSRTNTRTTDIDFSASDRKTKRLIELENLGYEIGGKTIFRDLSFTFTAGTRVGLVGPNGSGKTTLLRLLRNEIQPTSGAIKRAEFLRTVYFSQLREIDPSLTLKQALTPDGGDSVTFNGRQIHVASWANRFLFTGEQLNQPVDRLSGGERARVLIARLMLEPADLLLLDEPTNDLDIPTLEILEESLLEFPGALVLVTHDRYLLDRVSTTVLGLDGEGDAAQFADYSQWEEWKNQKEEPSNAAPVREESASPPTEVRAQKKKLSYLEAREFATIEQRVEEADERVSALKAKLEDHAVATNANELQATLAELETAQTEMETLYARWAELTEKAG